MAADSQLHLEIDSHVIHQLGEELITDTGQALLELAKNSYDADADYCHIDVDTRFDGEITIKYPNADSKSSAVPIERKFSLKGKITVKDNGHGMALEAIRRGWLTISLSQKREFKRSGKVTPKHNRTPLGDKGLGRIGTLKLGSFIVIETFTDPAHSGWKVSFSWADCKQGSILSDVPIAIESIPACGSIGTTLTVMGLNDLPYWKDENSMTVLSRQFSTLLSPFKSFDSFDVRFAIDSRPVTIEAADTYLNAAQARFSVTWVSAPEREDSVLDIDGSLKLILFRKTKNDPNFRRYVEPDHGEALYKYFLNDSRTKPLNLKRTNHGWFLDFHSSHTGKDVVSYFLDARRADPGPFMGEVYDIDITEGKSQIASQKTTRPQFLETYNGVFVYRDNFRIRLGEDWLGLGERWTKGASYYGLRPGNTLGWIGISAKDNQQLIEKSDREGFVDNPAKRGFDFLMRDVFVREVNECIAACRRAYNDFLAAQKNVENDRASDYAEPDALKELETSAESSAEIAAVLSDNVSILDDLTGIVERFETGVKSDDAKAVTELLPDVRALAQRMHSRQRVVPQLIKAVSALPHAVRTVHESFETEEAQNRELYSAAATGLSAEGLVHEISSVVGELLHSLNDLEKVAKVLGIKNARFFGNIRSAEASGREIVERIHFLDPMLRNLRGIREPISVPELVKEFHKHKAQIVAEHRMKLTIIDSGEVFTIKANRGRIIQVLDNLTRNSIYWLDVVAKAEPGFQPEMTIEIAKPILRFSDNGFGIEDRIAARIFDAFVSGKPEGEGHGLGLFLCRQLLAVEKGTIQLLPELNMHGRRFAFEIDLTGALE